MRPIYLDYNATTPIAPQVAAAMRPYIDEHFGNPSSSHLYGQKAREAVEHARSQVAGLLGCNADEIIFTSGGTESNNFAITGIALRMKEQGNHIITSAVEHPAVTEVCQNLKRFGFEITYIPVDHYGLVDPDDVAAAITSKTILITVMHANNEVGAVQPIGEIGALAREHGVLFHTDAAQSVAKIPTHVTDLNVDMLSIAGHKLYAPKGVGALYLRRGTKPEKLMHGAGHEFGLRPGTENVIGIVGLGAACELAAKDPGESDRIKRLRDGLYKKIMNELDDVRLNGPAEQRLPNTLSLSFRNLPANEILSRATGIAASAGAACHSDKVTISHVLQAMGIPEEWAKGTIRFSLGRMTAEEEIDLAADEVISTVKRLRT